MKKYNIIYADPPWWYNDRKKIRKDGKTPRFGIGARNKYPCMKTDKIAALPVGKIADKNCVLFLWVTFPMLLDGLRVMEAWGFKYKTLGFSWLKINKIKLNPFFGTGHYAKSNVEVCLMGLKGKVKPISNKVSSAIVEPLREHSRKPDQARDRIVQLFGYLPRIELFTRNNSPGWDLHGDEIGKF